MGTRTAKRLAAVGLLGTMGALLVGSPALAAVITPNTFADENGGGTACSLREAILAANNDTAFGGCPAGGGADTIPLPPGTTRCRSRVARPLTTGSTVTSMCGPDDDHTYRRDAGRARRGRGRPGDHVYGAGKLDRVRRHDRERQDEYVGGRNSQRGKPRPFERDRKAGMRRPQAMAAGSRTPARHDVAHQRDSVGQPRRRRRRRHRPGLRRAGKPEQRHDRRQPDRHRWGRWRWRRRAGRARHPLEPSGHLQFPEHDHRRQHRYLSAFALRVARLRWNPGLAGQQPDR